MVEYSRYGELVELFKSVSGPFREGLNLTVENGDGENLEVYAHQLESRIPLQADDCDRKDQSSDITNEGFQKSPTSPFVSKLLEKTFKLLLDVFCV